MNDYTNPETLNYDEEGFYLYGLETGPARICVVNPYADTCDTYRCDLDVEEPDPMYDFVADELPDLDFNGKILAIFQDPDFPSFSQQYIVFQFDDIPNKPFLLYNAGGICFELAHLDEFTSTYGYKALAPYGGSSSIGASDHFELAFRQLCKKVSKEKYKESLK